jgi:hypothetical protein
MRWSTACSVALVSLTGCYGAPTPEQISNANYGSYPAAYKAIVKAFYGSLLKDPDSTRYQSISPPVRSWWGDLIFGVKYGYRVCVTVSAKDPHGGYVGYKTDALMINNGRVIDYVSNGNIFGTSLCS